MGKTIAIITDFTKTYWTDFKQEFNKKNAVPIDVLIFNDGAAQSLKIKDNHIAIKFSIDAEMSVVLIKQADLNTNKTRMKLVLNEWCQNITEIGIAAHASNGTLNVESLTNDKSYHYKTFNHYDNGSKPVWMKIKPLFNQLKTGEKDTKLFNALWSVLAPKPSDIAHRLRSEILTPFIPFHLYFQLDNKNESEWNKILTSTCEAIKNIADKNLNELWNIKKDISDEYKTALTKAFNDLKKLFSQTNAECIKTQDCRKAIEIFADCLEDVVNYIEFGEVASCQE